ncbi:hypothetical protein H6G11_10675 [Cyanobacterium aponinum FACHB-4101]|uniref:hypothetical protein n=1 Tax=Cyanobacterium aponinum TaxID=379064 RepID=UPI0016815A20|nr:hypothetical protein [Cyanobacterium aponinum]MBD2394714.1 hypothetical protein [Cyanobacterium aponinum FACHB-4101]
MTNLFDEIFDDIYNKIIEEEYFYQNSDILLEYSIKLWCQKIGLNHDYIINNNYIFYYIKKLSNSLYQEWEAKTTDVLEKNTQRVGFNIIINAPYYGNQSPLYRIIKKFIDQLQLGGKNMNNDNIKVLVFLGLIITGVAFVVYKLNQENTPTSNQKRTRSTSVLSPKATIAPQLILIVNASKKDCLDKIQNQGNKIQPKDCDKLYRATKFLWMGTKDELDKNFKNYDSYIAQQDQESEYDVYLVQIDLPEMMEGFKQDANTLDRIDAFRELINLPIKISPRLKVSIYENTNVYTC